MDSGAIVKGLSAEFGSTVAGGQGDLKGKIFRVAHLGYYDTTDILGLLATLEIALHRLGHKFDARRGDGRRGKGVRRAHGDAGGRPAARLSYRILVLEGITASGLALLKAEGWASRPAEGDAAGRARRPSSGRTTR